MGQPLTRQALIENLKSGQLTPPISALLTSLINSGQLQRTPSGKGIVSFEIEIFIFDLKFED